ncbi:hypothetical protein RGQ29_013150 [Quercus rubra]|uniref:TsaA-like domain-containing protein n=1 Tax=Quercus rubra TaxID=3512 RepID=A0AAN7G3S3_QUERU|nr:hypothetical protein RGQ29_013150 [Quercus rubra]
MASSQSSKFLTLTATITLALAAALSASTALSFYMWRRKSRSLESKVAELEKSLKSSMDKCCAERQGRIRAQQALRKGLAHPQANNLELSAYPMAPIGIIQSCYSTRNGTPRQPLLVPLARACLIFDPSRVPPASLEGLKEYSHCWIIYVFHLNTNLENLWKQPSKSRFKAKVRVPRLKGGRMGVFATRSPHRPCPIGLTVAKVEAVQDNMVLLSGVDLVDGTEDNLLAVASVSFSEDFPYTLAECWVKTEKKSLYASPDEFQSLIKQVLSWDIRSLAQRNRPHDYRVETENGIALGNTSDSDSYQDEKASTHVTDQASPIEEIIYHLSLEGLDVSYRIDCNGNVLVEKVTISSDVPDNHRKRCNYSEWSDKLRFHKGL